MQSMHEQVSEYYGKIIKKTEDLKYEACVVGGDETKHHKQILAKVSPKVTESFYGCGSPIPNPLEGTTSIDLGCGTGRDCFVISALAGKTGHVIGIDMTQEQIDVAIEAIAYHKEHIPDASTIEFRKGFIEDLRAANIPDNFADVVVSNCVINLSPQKKEVFKEIYRVLKEGGELHFSDVFCDRTLPQAAREDKVLVGECIGNAMDINTFIAYMKGVGFKDFRVVTSRILNLPEFPPELIEQGTVFWSITISAFKGVQQPEWKHDVVKYKGGIPGSPHTYKLDKNHHFKIGEKVPVYSNIAEILSTKRYSPFFEINKDETCEAPSPDPSFMEVVFASESSSEKGCCCGSRNCC